MSDVRASLSTAKWIWTPEHQADEVNAHFEFLRKIEIAESGSYAIAITADSRYHLLINGEWVSDGPARGYPDLGFVDEITVSLRRGANTISVIVDSYGVDTFQYIRGVPGVLFALSAEYSRAPLLVSDEEWRVRRAIAYGQQVPRISCQQGFEEHFDARLESVAWQTVILAPKADRPLKPRTTGLLGQVRKEITRTVCVDRVVSVNKSWSIPVRRLLSPFPKGINSHGMAGAFASRLFAREEISLRFYVVGSVAGIFLNGSRIALEKDQDLQWCDLALRQGANWLGVAVCTECDHITDIAFGCEVPESVEWKSPVIGDPGEWAGTGPLWTAERDTNCQLDPAGPSEIRPEYVPPFGSLFPKDKPALLERVCLLAQGPELTLFAALPAMAFSAVDAYFAIRTDRVLETGVKHTDVLEAGRRVLFDLGEMTLGYLEMELEAVDGSIVDIFFFENLEGGRVQYLEHDGISYRNSLRYTAKEGRHKFRSRQRRGFRYVQVVVRRGPVQIHTLAVVESTYAPKMKASFVCSDERLNQIFAISQRTLLLCMEDTFTDCPTYEQTFWLGDAKNEMLFAHYGFGAADLTEHCLRLGAHSSDQLPLVASQSPSGWDLVIPSFSFLWGLAVWECYWHTGNRDFLREIYPVLKKNLETALLYCTDCGLFSSPTWNFFDWTGIDQDHETVLHNSMLLAAVLQAGILAAKELGESDDQAHFEKRRAHLVEAIDKAWSEEANSYGDAIVDGRLSSKTSQHTSFLGLLYDLVPSGRRQAALENCINPPLAMARVGSPNAMFFLLEALLKEGRSQEVLSTVRTFWGQMMDHGATTFWEKINPEGAEFPTRSHCHGWASSPIYLLPQLFFEIKCLEPGWRKISLKPRSLGLDFVRAEICTPYGLLKMESRRSANGNWETQIDAPPEIGFSIIGSDVIS